MLKNKEGSVTLESSIVVSVAIFIIISLVYFALFLHDETVVNAVVNTEMVNYSLFCSSYDNVDMEEKIESKLKKALFVSEVKQLQWNINDDEMEVCAVIKYHIPLRFINEITKICGGEKEYSYKNNDKEKSLFKWRVIKSTLEGGYKKGE